MRRAIKFGMVYIFTTLLVWMALGWTPNHKVISPSQESATSAQMISGRGHSSMILQDGFQIYAVESSSSHQYPSEPGYFPFFAFAAEPSERSLDRNSVLIPKDVALNFTSHDLVYPFHEFT